jgi:hypothetical protein
LELLISLIIIIAILVIPIKMAASMMGARRTGVLYCLVAVILASLIQQAVARVIPSIDQSLGMLLAIPLAAISYMLVLDTTFIKGICIAILQGVILVLGLLGLGILFANLSIL